MKVEPVSEFLFKVIKYIFWIVHINKLAFQNPFYCGNECIRSLGLGKRKLCAVLVVCKRQQIYKFAVNFFIPVTYQVQYCFIRPLHLEGGGGRRPQGECSCRPQSGYATQNTPKLTGFFFVQLSVTSSAGSYIKELVHGDFVRTVPSVKSILDIETDILALGT